MKKGVLICLATLLAVAVALPAFAAVEFQYGGQFRVRWISSNNLADGSSDMLGGISNQDNNNFFDQRLRLYFTFKASENLKVVAKFEIGDVVWGDYNKGGRMGADTVNVETKNAYIQFNIPNIPTTAVLGIQPIALLDSWIVDDDFSAAAFVTKLEPITVTLAYIAGQHVPTNGSYYSSTRANVDDYAFAVNYAQKGVPIKGTLTGVFMNANQAPWALYPEVMNTPVSGYGWGAYGGSGTVGAYPAQISSSSGVGWVANSFPTAIAGTDTFTAASLAGENFGGASLAWFGNLLYGVKDNQMFDLGLNLTYKIDFLSAYINFAKNIGSVKTATRQFVGYSAPYTTLGSITQTIPATPPATVSHGQESIWGTPSTVIGTETTGTGTTLAASRLVSGTGLIKDVDYTGWMIDAGASYFCGPYTFNLGGFYTSGQKTSAQNVYLSTTNGTGMAGPGATAVHSLALSYVDTRTGNVITNAGNPVFFMTNRYQASDDIDFFTYPGTTSKYFSEIVGGGILDSAGPFASAAAGNNGSNYWRGYGFPSNIWTITAGAAWQVLEKTKLSFSYWYFQTSEKVGTGRFALDTLSEQMSNDLGHEFDLYITQGIVDGLTLDIVGAFMLTGDAYSRSGYLSLAEGAADQVLVTPVTWGKDNVYEIGARLQWEF